MNLLAVSIALFCIGLYGVLTRRDLVAVVASVEVMLGGAFLLLVGLGSTSGEPATVQAVALLLLVVAAAEAAVGLALVVAVSRTHRGARVDELTEVSG